jgi:hypothetical protein
MEEESFCGHDPVSEEEKDETRLAIDETIKEEKA